MTDAHDDWFETPEGDANKARALLEEWYAQWHDRDDMPAKMDDALHVRTALFLGFDL